MVLSTDSLLCAQQSLLVGFRRSNVVVGVKCRSVMFKTSTVPTVLSLTHLKDYGVQRMDPTVVYFKS